jgi:hypothetical protein
MPKQSLSFISLSLHVSCHPSIRHHRLGDLLASHLQETVHLRSRILPDDVLHLLLIRCPIFLKEVERIGLRWRLGVRLVEQRLDTEQDLFNSDGGFPALFFVEDGETDCARGIDVWVEEWGGEFACRWNCQLGAAWK